LVATGGMGFERLDCTRVSGQKRTLPCVRCVILKLGPGFTQSKHKVVPKLSYMRKSGDNMFEIFLETFWTPTIVWYSLVPAGPNNGTPWRAFSTKIIG